MVYETREVLAGAYRKNAPTLLTHTVRIADDETETPICARVKSDNICDGGSLSEAGRAEAPTCPTCRARDPRFNPSRAADLAKVAK